MASFGVRVARLRKQKNISQAELARRSGIPQSTIAQLETGRNKSTKKIIELAAALDTTPNYLVNGIEDLSNSPASLGILSSKYRDLQSRMDKILTISYYDINLSAGISDATWVIREPNEKLPLMEKWFVDRGISISSVKAMFVRGESMEPLLYNKDTILLDITDTEIVDGDVYAIIYKNRLYIRELRVYENGIDIISRHPDYKPMHVTDSTYVEFKVLGKMIWRGG